MTIEEAVKEIKAYIDQSNASMLSKMNTKFEQFKDSLAKKIKSSAIISERIK